MHFLILVINIHTQPHSIFSCVLIYQWFISYLLFIISTFFPCLLPPFPWLMTRSQFFFYLISFVSLFWHCSLLLCPRNFLFPLSPWHKTVTGAVNVPSIVLKHLTFPCVIAQTVYHQHQTLFRLMVLWPLEPTQCTCDRTVVWEWMTPENHA